MATMSQAESRRMYSWWWDSHISPKNSKWLQENLTDIDVKVKAMIKLIEEDADSFARRAEMYYKKRPELMKLVEEFYRAYRALAERYDHATGALRQAQRTMQEAFPNQIPFSLADDSPASSASDADPHTPEMTNPTRPLLDPDDLQKDALGLSSSNFHAAKRNGAFTDEHDSVTSRKGLKQLNDLFGFGEQAKFAEGKVRKGLNFNEAEEKQSNEQLAKFEKEVLILKEALAELEAEKEDVLAQYKQRFEEVSKLESEVSSAQEDSRELSKQASEAQAEAKTLKEALSRLEAEKEASILQYQQCLDKISNMENILSRAQGDAGELNERASKAESEAQSLKQDLAKVEAAKDAALDQYKKSLEMISGLEEKLLLAEEGASKSSERAERAEIKVETLNQAIAKLTAEKEAAALQYQQCLETISSLELKVSLAQEEVKRLNAEIDSGLAKLKGAEERCLMIEISNQSLHTELESLVLKMGTQSQELTEKQEELGRLWKGIQEERLRYMEAETAFQTLQHLHSQAQDELRSMATELQNKAQTLSDMETCNQNLQGEILKLKEENMNINELNVSSALSMANMQSEIVSLRETNGKLEGEVELRVDQRNALQQEIYCLKEELNDLNKKHQAITEQVDTVGMNPESFGSSVKELQEENSTLKENFQSERSEKVALMEKLEIMEQLLEKNALLENSLSDLGAELEGTRAKIKALEVSCQSFVEEKSSLLDEKTALRTQLLVNTEDLKKLSEKNTVLENSLSDAHDELEVLKLKSKSLEDSSLLLVNAKADLLSEKDTLASQIEIMRERFEDLEKRFTELEERYSALEKDKESALCEAEELKVSLDVQKQDHVNFAQMSWTQLAVLETQMHHLQEEGRQRSTALEEELDKALNSQIEIFVLQRCVQDLQANNLSLSVECRNLLEASKLSEKLISELEKENLEQKFEVKSLSDQNNMLRTGIYQLMNALGILQDHGFEDNKEQDQKILDHILSKAEDTKSSLCEARDENLQLAVEMSILLTLLEQLRSEGENLEMEKNVIEQQLSIRTEQFSVVQGEASQLFEITEELRSKVREGDKKEEVLAAQIENLRGNLLDMEGACDKLQEEKSEVVAQKQSLTREFLELKERNQILEEENFAVFGEMLSLGNLSLIFENYVHEKSLEAKELGEDLAGLHGVNSALEEKLGITEKKLEEVEVENLLVKETLVKSEHELKTVLLVSNQLNSEIVNGKNQLNQKEVELSEAEQKLSVTNNEKSELHKIVEDLKSKYDEVKLIREDQEKQILKLSEEKDHLSKENGCLSEGSRRLEVALHQLREEDEKTKNREEKLYSELQNGVTEIDMWEAQAAALYGELQTYTISHALFEEKVRELSETSRSLQDESSLKDKNNELLKERVSSLEGENKGLKAQLAPYGPAIIYLRDTIASLENHVGLHTKLQQSNNEEEKDAKLENHLHVESHLSEDQNATVPDAFSDVQDLQIRIKAIEKTVIEMERHPKHSHRENARSTSEISEVEIGLLPKDIMLDQISECSSFGINRRENAEADNRMLELWESVDRGGKVKKAGTPVKPAKENNDYPISDLAIEKELGIDKLAISKRYASRNQEGNTRKVLERLNSDIQKLTNLQITIQDLKRKVEITEKSKKGKRIVDCDNLKEQLEESEEAVLKLFDLNAKLTKNIEDSKKSDELELEESENVMRRRVSEQGRRMSEKIGRLQLEVQRIQFILVKIDDEKESSNGGRFLDAKRRVLLRDYIYGGGRKGNNKKKKAPFCGCIQPATKGD
ncbi:hypothetical protein LguiA_020420 [Lonicera macranthoides]